MASMMIPTTHHLISIPHPLYPHFLVCIIHLKDSLFIWVGEGSAAAAQEAQQLEQYSDSNGDATTQSKVAISTVPDQLSEEDARQAEVDRQVDQELAKALADSGRGMPGADGSGPAPQGSLAQEWAVAMWKSGVPPTGTSLFRTPADVAMPMSRRLAKRLETSQIHLSMSLPPDMLPRGNMPAPPGSGAVLMSIERGIEEAVIAARRETAVAQ